MAEVEETKKVVTFTERLPSIFDNLNTFIGLLEALFTFGNTLELIYIGGMVYKPPTLVPSATGTIASIEVPKSTSQRPQPLIPFYVDIKAKKCHSCSRPIVNYKHGLFCSNIYQGLENLNHACYKFVCKDCLGDSWDQCKNNLLYKCACCRGQCPPTSVCSTAERVKENPQSFVDRDIYWYQWRGKRCHVFSRIVKYNKIKKQHKIFIHETSNSTPQYLEKENFFELASIPKNSPFWRYLKRDGQFLQSINFRDLVHDSTLENIRRRGLPIFEYVQKHYK
jgi:hypothetical protein